MGPVALNEECCSPSCEEPVVVRVPGSPGDDGADGADGEDGIDAFTTLTASFVMPAEGANVSAAVGSTAWMTVGQILFVQTAGYMEVISLTNSTTVVLKNLEATASSAYTINAAPATVIPAASKVSPAGLQGPSGALTGAAGGSLEGTYPNPTLAITTTVGDILVNNGGGTAPRMTRLAAGVNGTVLHSDNTQATGRRQSAIDLTGVNTSISGAVPIANGGTGQTAKDEAYDALSPNTTRGDVTVMGAAGDNVPLAVGAANTVWQSDGTDPSYAKLNANHLATSGATALSRVPSDYILIRDEKADGTAGGTFTSGAWQTRTLNTETVDTGTHAAVAANQITLQAGTYRFRATAPAYKVDTHRLRLQNITAGTTVATGPAMRAAAAGDDIMLATVEGRFTIASATVFEVQHRSSATKATDGFGLAATFGVNEVFAQIELWREAL